MKAAEEIFPLILENNSLVALDFQRFWRGFSGVVRNYLLTANSILFHDGIRWVNNASLPEELPDDLAVILESEVITQEKIVKGETWIAFVCPVAGDGKSVRIVGAGMDPYVVKKAATDWLQEIRHEILRDFLLVKQGRTNCQTGLLNLGNLYQLLEEIEQVTPLQLTLIELSPPAGNLQKRARYRRHCTMALERFFGEQGWRLHYLGDYVYGFLHRPEEGGSRIGPVLTEFLKREGCKRVHVGSSGIAVNNSSIFTPKALIGDAWLALEIATKRGPFSFYDRSRFVETEEHPLAGPAQKIRRRISRIVRNLDKFSLVLFRIEGQKCDTSAILNSVIADRSMINGGRDCYLVLEGMDGDEAKNWVQPVIDEICQKRPEVDILAGISTYPLMGWKKGELVIACHKAVLHASFYGRSVCTCFDALSLNISGDVYYGEGDLLRAVKEYRRGLQLDPEQVNLHNSLGVCLAMMNRRSQAMNCFIRALQLEETSFLALYNLGLAEESRGEYYKAFAYLVKALEHFDQEAGTEHVLEDLHYRCGMLASETGCFSEAIYYFNMLTEGTLVTGKPSRESYHLGLAYYGLGCKQDAMASLQRALRYNEFDDRAMHMLAKIYFEEREGDDIARSLLCKCLELEPENRQYQLSLGAVELRCGNVELARIPLTPCLRSRRFADRARLLLGRYYLDIGENRKAKSWLVRLSERRNQDPSIRSEYDRLMKRIEQ